MIELVIKIPEKVYNALTHTEFDANLVVDEMRKAIADGTPLDKIRERISLEKLGYPPSANYYKAIMKCLQIIDKHLEGSDSE